MADNVQITEGTGTAVHADEYTHATFGAGKTQLVKLAIGAPGAGVDLIAGAGAVTTGTPRVTLASDDPLVAAVAAPSTGTQSIVASSASDVTILASNASRKGFYVYNDSTQVLYLLLANATSSATVFTQKMAAGDAFSAAPGTYSGVVKGIWASANGNARVTEWA